MNHGSTGLALFLIALSLFLLTSGGHLYVRDEGAMYLMSTSIIDTGWFDVPINPNTGGGKHGPDGKYYMPFGLLQPVLAIPLILLGRVLIPWSNAQYLPIMTAAWFNAFITAWLCVVFYRFLLRLRVPESRAFLAALACAFSTPFWVYAQTFFAEPLTALGILSSADYIYRYGQTRRLHFILFAGIWMMVVLIVRPIAGTAIPALFLYLLLVEKRSADMRKQTAQIAPMIVFSLLCTFAVSLVLFYNYIRFGGFIETGYDYLPDGRLRNFTLDPLQGLAVLFISPGKSIFVFAPLSIAAIIGIVLWMRSPSTRPEAILCALTPALFISILCRWAEVEGGVCWGPRLFLPALPIWLLALAPLLSLSNRRVLLFIGLLACVGIGVQFLGVSINFSSFINSHIDSYFNPQTGYYLLSFNPFPGHIDLLIKNLVSSPLLKPLPYDVAAFHRSMSQINYADGLNFWWLLSYQNRLTTSFILVLFVAQVSLLLTGITLAAQSLFGRSKDVTSVDS